MDICKSVIVQNEIKPTTHAQIYIIFESPGSLAMSNPGLACCGGNFLMIFASENLAESRTHKVGFGAKRETLNDIAKSKSHNTGHENLPYCLPNCTERREDVTIVKLNQPASGPHEMWRQDVLLLDK